MLASESVMEISWGPQHPMSGQIRFIVKTDGERVFEVKPDMGFNHRGLEKILEHRSFMQGVVPVERMCMADAANMGLAYIRAIEELVGIDPPKRAQYIRTILCEMSRINSHLYGFGLMAEACGGYPAVFLWTVADRELFLDLCEMLTGARWSHSFFCPGGVLRDLPTGFKDKALKVLDYFERRLEIYKDAWLENVVFEARSRNLGILRAEDALKLGATGPSLRGSGVAIDMRKEEGYDAYGEIDFKVITQPEGDSYARTMVRYLEMVESVKIIRQALESIPEGPIRVRAPLKPKFDESYVRVESARGELAFHMMAGRTDIPYRVKINPPTFRNLYVISRLPKLTEILTADIPVVIYSFDPWYLDADR